MRRLTRDGTAEPVLRDQILRRERGQGKIHFPYSADLDHQDYWQPYLVDPYPCNICMTVIHTYYYCMYHDIARTAILLRQFDQLVPAHATKVSREDLAIQRIPPFLRTGRALKTLNSIDKT